MMSLRILFLAVLATSRRHDESMNPRYTALDLNITISWDQPDVDWAEDEEILYTVIYHKRVRRRGTVEDPVTSCVNITRTACCLVEKFSPGEFSTDERFHVVYMSSTRPTVHGRSTSKTFNKHDIDISAPTIHSMVITSRNITFWVRAPATPFFDMNGRQMLMGENSLIGWMDLTGFKIYFNSTLTDLDDPADLPLKKDWEMSDRGKLRMTYRHLQPNSQYCLEVRSKYREKQSKDVATTKLRTEQEAPEIPPMIIGTSVERSSCDVRDLQVSWKESSSQRGSVHILNYTVTFVGSKSHEEITVVVPGDTFSLVSPAMDRWEAYRVRVMSTNSKGNKTGFSSTIHEDEHIADSYKPTDMEITRVSSRLWNLTWVPATQHQQCTVGYGVTTSMDGTNLEETILIEGYEASSAKLHFKNFGRYAVNLSPMINDSVRTAVSVTMDYYVKDWKILHWAILVSVMILLVLTLAAVIFMLKKVCCDLDTLPDISKSGPMRIASRNKGFVHSLKPPPEKEVFNTTSRPAIENKSTALIDCTCSDDEVFEPKPSFSDPSSPLQEFFCPNESPELPTADGPTSALADGRSSLLEGNEPSSEKELPGNDICISSSGDSYVSEMSAYKTASIASTYLSNDHITIPKPGTLSTQSSDSGVSSTAYGSDYVPPSPLSDSAGPDNVFGGYVFEADYPYVASVLADRSGRIPSESSSSEPDDGIGYRRIDSRRLDEQPRGYLPMIPASPRRMNAQTLVTVEPPPECAPKDI